MNKKEFIDEIYKYLKKYAKNYNICCYSVPIAQACKESAFGTSELAKRAFNFFGLKYKSNICKEYYIKPAIEQASDGNYYTVDDTKWCKFNSIEEGVKGYLDFINNSRYANLKGVKDYKTYIKNIKADGYCTSISYVESIINDYIFKYDLLEYDKNGGDNMSNSSLVSYTKLVKNYTPMINKKINKITIHHMAGNLSLEVCGNIFNGTRQASSNYAIDSNGKIALYVEEKNRAWTSSSSWNDSQAITIEVANDNLKTYSISDKTYKSLIDLCVDICKRNDIKKLEFTGDKNGTLTYHYMFAATACPGPYIKSLTNKICNDVNSRLNNNNSNSNSNTECNTSTIKKENETFKVKVSISDLNIRKGPSTSYPSRGFTGVGVFTIVEKQGDWYLLKSYAKNRDGWIHKNYCTIL